MGSISLKRGFTIVELLIVIVVIAILAAVTIVAFNGVQQRAKTAAITVAVDTWEKTLRSAVVVQGSLGSLLSGSCLGKNVGEFPAEGIFLSGECVVVSDPSGTRLGALAYSESDFSGWEGDRPSGKLPTTEFKVDASTVLHARGLWISNYAPVNKVVMIAWVPNVNGSCGRGQIITQGSQPLGALDGGYCYLNIFY